MTPRALMLMGPTASGKTGLALALAEHFDIEIVSVDSALVYRDMDIGTAKPTLAERARCPHHLIDIIDPTEAYSAAQFCEAANTLVEAICRRGRLPVLVGGTMMYYKALFEGLSDLPQADPALRAQLDAEAAAEGWPALHRRLASLDPDTAVRLAPNDAQRIQRALEICLLTGQTMSALTARDKAASARFESLALALVPAERAWLHGRIAERFGQMLEAGFIDEVASLRRLYPGLTPELPSMRCVGYRQAWAFLDGEDSYDDFIDKGIAATRQLAKRQLTWTRSLPVIPLNAQAPDLADSLFGAVEDWQAGHPADPALAYTGPF